MFSSVLMERRFSLDEMNVMDHEKMMLLVYDNVCSSHRFARKLADRRPFISENELLSAARSEWMAECGFVLERKFLLAVSNSICFNEYSSNCESQLLTEFVFPVFVIVVCKIQNRNWNH